MHGLVFRGWRPIPSYYRRMLRAILFDFNGVLVDDEPIQFQLVQRVLAEAGLALDTSDYMADFVGLSDQRCFEAAMDRAGLQPDPKRVARLVARKADYYQEIMQRQGFPFFPGAVQLAASADEAGYMLGVVSGALREEVEAALSQSGLRQAFKCVVTADDVESGKPDPAGYRLALDQLNSIPPLPNRLIHPHEVLAIEDTPHGLRAAWSAGLVSLGIAQTFDRSALDMADFVADGLGGLDVDELQRIYAEVSRR